MFAQARMPIRCMGTTHADYFRGDIPVTRPMRRDEVERDYEKNTGLVIVETFAGGLSPSDVRRCSWRTMVRSPGVRTRPGRSSMRACSSISLAWSGASGRWRPTHPPGPVPGRQALLSQARAEGLLRPEVSVAGPAASRPVGPGRHAVDSGDYHWRAWRDTMRMEKGSTSPTSVPR